MEFEVCLSNFFLASFYSFHFNGKTCKLCPTTFNSGMFFIDRVVSMIVESRIKSPFNCNISCDFLRKQKKSGKHVIYVTYV